MDRLETAQARGDLPRAPGHAGLWSGLLGIAGAAVGAHCAPWQALADATWGGGDLDTAWSVARRVAAPLVSFSVVGALLGLAVGQATTGAWSFRLRSRVVAAPAPKPVAIGLLAGAGALAAALAVLTPLPRPDGDLGRVLLSGPLWAAGVALVALAPAALLERAQARRAWRDRVEPQPPPRREDGEPPPEIRAAVRDRLRR